MSFNESLQSIGEAPEFIAKGIGARIPRGVLLGAENFLKSSLAVIYGLTFLRSPRGYMPWDTFY